MRAASGRHSFNGLLAGLLCSLYAVQAGQLLFSRRGYRNDVLRATDAACRFELTGLLLMGAPLRSSGPSSSHDLAPPNWVQTLTTCPTLRRVSGHKCPSPSFVYPMIRHFPSSKSSISFLIIPSFMSFTHITSPTRRSIAVSAILLSIKLSVLVLLVS